MLRNRLGATPSRPGPVGPERIESDQDGGWAGNGASRGYRDIPRLILALHNRSESFRHLRKAA